ncbi:hypothetical protein UFOVP617_44 [uncultured Caudovirales phage]|jgi:hypothetical protein|uniref:Uncharacterized protein n=1 Tax=uncultured Caudovirales phage TaxID=2100421 RepID=A0A6J5N4P5_9CAUD|nr:hypothetical protein UFOVP617_44 [uncultured Caudovirales phage]
MSRNTLFISVKTIKERTGLHANVDEKLILPEILTSQDMYILPALGTALYNRLQDGIDADDLTADETDLLDTYITNCLVYYVMSELPMGLSYQFYNKGVVRKSSDNTDMPSAQDMIDVANRYKARAEFYKQRLVKFLRQSSTTTVFPLYNNPGNGVDTIRPDIEAYTTSIWLGDDCGCKGKSFEQMYQGNINSCCDGE